MTSWHGGIRVIEIVDVPLCPDQAGVELLESSATPRTAIVSETSELVFIIARDTLTRILTGSAQLAKQWFVLVLSTGNRPEKKKTLVGQSRYSMCPYCII